MACYTPRTVMMVRLAVFGIVVFLAVVIGVWLTDPEECVADCDRVSTTDRSTYAGILTGEVLYMPPPGDETMWIASPEVIEEAGIRVIPSPWQLSTGGNLAEAVIIDQHWWEVINQERPWPFFTEYKRQGVVIVGARVNIDDLLDGLDAGTAGDGWGNYPPDRNFYSIYSECKQGNSESTSMSQDYLDRHPESQFRLMLARIESHIVGNERCSEVGIS